MLPSGFTTSQITAASFIPASLARSTLPSVWPARTSTPPSRALRPGTWPLPRIKSWGVEFSSIATCTVRARSKDDVPVVIPVRASIYGVKGVLIPSEWGEGRTSRFSRLQMAVDIARQTSPQPLRIIKLMFSGVAFSAAMTKSPSFSRFRSSTTTISRPCRSSSIASSIEQ